MKIQKSISLRSKKSAHMVVCIILFLTTNLNAQENIVAVAQVEKMNMLYVGIDNPVHIAILGYKPESLEASINNGKLIATDKPGRYIAIPAERKEAVITIKEKGKEIHQFKFRVREIPNPQAKIAGTIGGEIHKAVLYAQYGIVAEVWDLNFVLKYKVIEYSVRNADKEDSTDVKTKGFKFTKEVKDFISNLKRGQKVLFYDIKAEGPDGKIRNLNSITFTLL